jgi:hypothetical protein
MGAATAKATAKATADETSTETSTETGTATDGPGVAVTTANETGNETGTAAAAGDRAESARRCSPPFAGRYVASRPLMRSMRRPWDDDRSSCTGFHNA